MTTSSDYRTYMTERFNFYFGQDPENFYFSPGRINLIGEHIDYLGGRVLPCAISLGIYAAVKPRTDGHIRMISLNFESEGVRSFTISSNTYDPSLGWANLPLGMLWAFSQRGFKLSHGFDILYYGTLPNSGGLSSSACLQVLTGYIYSEDESFDVDRKTLAQLVQVSENQFIGVNSGILDQFAITMGEKNVALYLDTASLDYEKVDVDFSGYKIVIMNTNKKRTLAESGYNQRRSECEQALIMLQEKMYKDSLCDYSVDALISIVDYPILFNRAFHAISENQRVKKAVQAIQFGDIISFGEYMFLSHQSLRHRYEVTVHELDVLVDFCWSYPGVIGARMTGAGFGGCAIALVADEQLSNFIETISEEYERETTLRLTCYVAETSDGVKKL